MSNRSAIQYELCFSSAGKFLTEFISTHYACKSIICLKTLDNDELNTRHIGTIIVPYIHTHFIERLTTLWEIGVDIKEFNNQHRMMEDYLFDTGYEHGNLYKDLRDERIVREDPPINLVFIDIGKLLSYNEQEYEKLIQSLNTNPLSTEDWIGGDWKNYVEQYRTQLEIISKNQMIVNRKV